MQSTLVYFVLNGLTILLLAAGPTYSDVSCTGGTFAAGSAASVRCDFGEDVTKTRQNLNVVQYGEDADDSGHYIVLCNWVSGTTRQDCTIKSGYILNQSAVKDTLVLTINKVDKSMEGLYVCQLVPDRGQRVHTCYLNVTEATTTSTEATPTPTQTSLLTTTEKPTTFPEDQGSAEDTGTVNLGLIIGVAVLAVLMLIILLCCFHMWWNFDLLKRKRKRTGSDEAQDGWNKIRCCLPFLLIMKTIHCVRPPAESKTNSAEGGQLLGNRKGVYLKEKKHIQFYSWPKSTKDVKTYTGDDFLPENPSKDSATASSNTIAAEIDSHQADPDATKLQASKDTPGNSTNRTNDDEGEAHVGSYSAKSIGTEVKYESSLYNSDNFNADLLPSDLI